MAKSPSHGGEMEGFYLIFWLRNYPHATGTRPAIESCKSMRYPSVMVCVMVALLVGCHKEEPLPPVPAPPEDLSTWSVPELVQPPPPETPVAQAPPQEKTTPAEQVL